jgi:hypothetical protein
MSPRLLHRFAVLLVLGLLPGAVPAAADAPGFTFLEVPAGARAAALGGAYTSLAQGSEAVFWNPAGLVDVKGFEITGSHVEYFQQLRHDQFAFGLPVGAGGLAASLRAMYTEPIVARDDLGNETGTFGSHDLEFALGYGFRTSERVRMGVTGQIVRERIQDLGATTFAFGAGVTWDPAVMQGLRLALSAHNLGKAAHYEIDGVQGAAVPLPMALQGGGSYGHALGAAWQARGALETRLTTGRSGLVMIGGELAHASGAALRAGWRWNDDAVDFSAGAGYALGRVQLDYAFVPFKLDLGDTHRISVAARF